MKANYKGVDIEITPVDDKIAFSFRYNEEIIDLMRRAGARWNSLKRWWELPVVKVENFERLFGIKIVETERVPKKIGGIILYDFQREAVAKAIFKNVYAWFDEMGLGKTIQVLATLKLINTRKNLIVAPKSVLLQWKREIMRVFSDEDIIIFIGKDFTDTHDKKIFHIINYDILEYLFKNINIEADYKHVVGETIIRYDAIVVDEAHYIKNTKAKRTKYVMALKTIPHRYVLTGTPLMNHPEELFPILHFLAPEIYKSKRHFCNMYCYVEQVRTPGGWIMKYTGLRNAEQLKKELSFISVRRTKREVMLQLPKKIHTLIPVEVSSDILRFEERFLKAIKVLKDLDILPPFFGDIGGAITKIRNELSKHKSGEVLEIASNILEERNRLVIFTDFHESVDIIASDLSGEGYRVKVITGETPAIERDAIVEWFSENTNDKRVLVATIRSAGEGLNLQVSDTALFVGLDWNPAKLLQAEARIHRIGAVSRQSNFIYLVAEGSIVENRLLYLLKEKSEMMQELLNEENLIEELDEDEIDVILQSADLCVFRDREYEQLKEIYIERLKDKYKKAVEEGDEKKAKTLKTYLQKVGIFVE